MQLFRESKHFFEKISNNKLKLVSILVICFIPMIYGFLFLSAFFNPYGKLSGLPIAVVNMDKGSIKENLNVNYGSDIVKNLKGNNKVKWQFTDIQDAQKGLSGNKYYSIIVIPQDFSRRITDVEFGKIIKPQIIYQSNEKKNFIVSQISSKILDEFMKEISTQISKQSSEVVINGLFNAKDGLKSAADGSKKLLDGSTLLLNGNEALVNGLIQAKNGSISLSSSMRDASNGSKALDEGMNNLVNGLNQFNAALSVKDDRVAELMNGATDLSNGISTAKKGAEKLSNGLNKGLSKASDGITKVASAIDEADANLQSVIPSVEESNLTDEEKQKIVYAQAIIKTIKTNNINKNIAVPLKKASIASAPLVDGLAKLEDGSAKLAAGTKLLVDGINEKQKSGEEGIAKLTNGAITLKNGTEKLSQGLDYAAGKTDELSLGLEKLSKGSAALGSGLNDLNTGTKNLNDGLNTGYKQISQKLNFNNTKMADFISSPINLQQKRLNPVSYYGEGFAPYFIPLALWVGALVVFTILDKEVKSNSEVYTPEKFLGRTLSMCLIGVIMSIPLSLLLIKLLSLNVKSVLLFYLFNMFLSVVIFAMFSCSIYILKDLGRLMMFLMLVLQLTSCGGTFPPELIPPFFNKVSPFLPMTYATAALREIVSGIDYSVLKYNISMLCVFMFGYTTISIVIKMAAVKNPRLQKLHVILNKG